MINSAICKITKIPVEEFTTRRMYLVYRFKNPRDDVASPNFVCYKTKSAMIGTPQMKPSHIYASSFGSDRVVVYITDGLKELVYRFAGKNCKEFIDMLEFMEKSMDSGMEVNLAIDLCMI